MDTRMITKIPMVVYIFFRCRHCLNVNKTVSSKCKTFYIFDTKSCKSTNMPIKSMGGFIIFIPDIDYLGPKILLEQK